MNPNNDPLQTNHEVAVAVAAPPARTAGYVDAGRYNVAAIADDAAPGGLLEYWNILRRRKGTVLLFAMIGTLIAVLVTLPQTPIYQARTSLEIQTMNQEFMNMRQVSPVSEDARDYWSNDIQTHIKLLQSESLLDRVVGRFVQAGTVPEASEPTGRISAWRRALKLAPSPGAGQREEPLKFERRNLKMRATGQTRVIEITCDSTDPKLAADFANALTNEYIDQSMEARWKMNQRTGEFLARQLEDMRIKLERSEDQLQRYARQAGLLFTGDKDKRNISEEKLRQLQEELGKAQADRIGKQSRYEMAVSSAPEALADVLNDMSLRDYQAKLTDLRRQEAELRATYKPEYSKVQRVQAQIVALDAALSRQREAIIQRIRTDFQEAQRRERLLAADYASQAKVVTSESEKSIQYNILQREVDTTRQLYEAMLQKVKESSIAAAIRASNVRVVDPANPPTSPYKPRIPLNGSLGLMAGMFLGVGFVVMRERADRTIQAPGDSQFYLNIPELGVVPEAGTNARRTLYYGRHKKLPAAQCQNGSVTGLATATATPKTTECVELITVQKKRSMAAESFRVVLTSILFSGENGHRPRVLVMTSAGPAEGKTTVTSNLAIALSEIRRKTLLIDADMRKPRMHHIFDLPNERGLSTLLQEPALTDEALAGIVQESPVPNLFVLPSGPSTSAASSLLHSPLMPELLKRLRKEFDMVLIDTAPMLQMPDARVVGRLADAVVLVTRSGKTTRDAAVAAKDRLTEDGTRVLGTILNDWNPKQSPNGYYGYSNGYGYYRGYSQHYYYAAQKEE